eukprot:TRINITY_DN17593_c0_g1_i1.p1 TRINITY_DN17593_c0_g1~~TRINITY_DN17593_c0_g1_i1.p1  ORF type:complete len:1170 (-),score=191.75 TRINITY_DN17593_c0_g1_i1:88-3486(-)
MVVFGGRYPVNRTLRGGDHYAGECIEGNVKDGQGKYAWANGDVYEGQYVKDKREGVGRLSRQEEGEEYVGAFAADDFHGRGELSRSDGTLIRGEWCDGQLVSGIQCCPDGSRYEGSFSAFGRHGFGRETAASGTAYEGEFANDVYHGKGTVEYSPEDASSLASRGGAGVVTFSGSFVHGQPRGVGTVVYTNGDRYSGGVDGLRREGQGRLDASSGEVYEGGWLADHREGHGACVFATGAAGIEPGDRYVGQWRADVRHGSGRHERPGCWSYAGPFEHGRRHGDGGTLETAAGDVWRGSWRHERMEGEGSQSNSRTGETYRGQFCGSQRHGRGEATLKSGTVYKGQWDNGEITGEGQMLYASSRDTYAGQFLNGLRSGTGRLEYAATGDVYEGDFLADRRHGRGVQTSRRTGEVYSGQWRDGCRSGEGEVTSDSGRCSYRGQWESGCEHGQGVMRSPEYTYSGSWLHGERHGEGQCEFADGSRYVGQWCRSRYHGKGAFHAASGAPSSAGAAPSAAAAETNQPGCESYDGEWVEGRREGQAEWRDGRGGVFKGWFKDGQLQGDGEAKLASGDHYRGQWRQGRKHGAGVFRFWDGSQIEGEWYDDEVQGAGVHVSAAGVRTSRTFGHLTNAISPSKPGQHQNPQSPLQSRSPAASKRTQNSSPPRGSTPTAGRRNSYAPDERIHASGSSESKTAVNRRQSWQSAPSESSPPLEELFPRMQSYSSRQSDRSLPAERGAMDIDSFMRRVEEQEQIEKDNLLEQRRQHQQQQQSCQARSRGGQRIRRASDEPPGTDPSSQDMKAARDRANTEPGGVPRRAWDDGMQATSDARQPRAGKGQLAGRNGQRGAKEEMQEESEEEQRCGLSGSKPDMSEAGAHVETAEDIGRHLADDDYEDDIGESADRGDRWEDDYGDESLLTSSASLSRELRQTGPDAGSRIRSDTDGGVDQRLRREQEHDMAVRLARGLAADNLQLRRELEDARQTIADLRAALANAERDARVPRPLLPNSRRRSCGEVRHHSSAASDASVGASAGSGAGSAAGAAGAPARKLPASSGSVTPGDSDGRRAANSCDAAAVVAAGEEEVGDGGCFNGDSDWSAEGAGTGFASVAREEAESESLLRQLRAERRTASRTSSS